MSQPNIFRFYLRYYDGSDWQYYYVVSGTVDITTTATELSRAPDGWQDCEIGWERGFTYYGMFTTYTTPLKFMKDAAFILRHLMYTTGIESPVELLVEKFNPASGVYAYETFFRGDLDMSKAQDEDDFVVCPIMEGGFAAKLKAREDTQYEFAIDGNIDVQYVYMDGLKLQAKLFYTAVDSISGASFTSPSNSFDDFPALSYYFKEGTNLHQKMFDVTLSPQRRQFIRNEEGSSVTYTFKIQGSYIIDPITLPSNTHFTIRLIEYDSAGDAFANNTTDIYIHPTAQSTSANGIYNVDFEATYTLPSNHYLGLGHIMAGGPLGTADPTSAATNSEWSTAACYIDMSVYFHNIYVGTYVPCLYVADVYRYLMAEISKDNLGVADATLDVFSTILDTTYADQLVITSGDGLRNLPGSKLKISFTDLFKFINSKFGASFYFDKTANEVYLEPKTEVFDNAISTTYPTIASVVNLRRNPFTQETFTNLKIGSGTFTYDQTGDEVTEVTNGKDEFNNTQQYLSPFVRVQKTGDYVSPIRCDMYGIEFTRINYSGKTISDSSNDNDVFAIHVEADDSSTYVLPTTGVTINYHLLFRTPIVVSTWEIFNIFSPETAFNILFSPKRSLVRNGNYFRALMKLNDSDYINFMLSGKNNQSNLKMYTETGGVIDYNEGAAIQISALCNDGAELFQPVVFDFETKEAINLYNLIESDPYKYIEFIYRGDTYRGFIISMKSKPALRGTTQFKLLASPTCDLSNLIR